MACVVCIMHSREDEVHVSLRRCSDRKKWTLVALVILIMVCVSFFWRFRSRNYSSNNSVSGFYFRKLFRHTFDKYFLCIMATKGKNFEKVTKWITTCFSNRALLSFTATLINYSSNICL